MVSKRVKKEQIKYLKYLTKKPRLKVPHPGYTVAEVIFYG